MADKVHAELTQKIQKLNFQALAIPGLIEENAILKQRIQSYLKQLKLQRTDALQHKVSIGDLNAALQRAAEQMTFAERALRELVSAYQVLLRKNETLARYNAMLKARLEEQCVFAEKYSAALAELNVLKDQLEAQTKAAAAERKRAFEAVNALQKTQFEAQAANDALSEVKQHIKVIECENQNLQTYYRTVSRVSAAYEQLLHDQQQSRDPEAAELQQCVEQQADYLISLQNDLDSARIELANRPTQEQLEMQNQYIAKLENEVEILRAHYRTFDEQQPRDSPEQAQISADDAELLAYADFDDSESEDKQK